MARHCARLSRLMRLYFRLSQVCAIARNQVVCWSMHPKYSRICAIARHTDAAGARSAQHGELGDASAFL
eukprot:5028388-Amphidinium_carterae.2